MMLKNNEKKIFKNREKRWCFRDLELIKLSSRCLQDSNFPSYNMLLLPAPSYRNICLITNSSKHVYRKFRLARHAKRFNILNGNAYGIQKGLW